MIDMATLCQIMQIGIIYHVGNELDDDFAMANGLCKCVSNHGGADKQS